MLTIRNAIGSPSQIRYRMGGGVCSLAVIFLQYNPERFHGHFEHLKDLFAGVKKTDVDYYLVDNQRVGEWQTRRSDGVYVIGGDNSSREFSGWNKGLRFIQASGKQYDLILFTNDTFKLNQHEYIAIFDDRVFSFAATYGIATGVFYFINARHGVMKYFFFRPSNFQCNGWQYKYWIRSNLFMVPYSMLSNSALPILNTGTFFPEHLTGKIFKDTAGMSANLQNYIIDYLCPRDVKGDAEIWHSHFHLDETSYDYFTAKAMSILHEFNMVRFILQRDCPIADIRLLAAIANLHRCRTNRLPMAARSIVSNPVLQVYILHHYKRFLKLQRRLSVNYSSIGK